MSVEQATPALAPGGATPAGAPNLRVMWLMVVATFVVFLNETTMGVALRTIMLDLGVEAGTGQWVTTAFMLTMAVVIPATGFVIQRMSTRPVFVIAMALFVAGTLLAAVSHGFSGLLVGRVVQACGTALMLPLLMTTVMTLVPVSSRGAMMGSVALVISVAPAIGPVLSGVLINTVGWRGIFWLMLPAGLAMLAVGLWLVDNIGEPRPAPLDLVSVPLSALAFGAVVLGLSRVGADDAASGDGGVPPALALAIGVVAMAGFVLRQLRLQREDRALLDLRTLAHRPFVVTLVIMCANMAALFGVIIVLPIYLQGVLHLPPVQTGLLVLPGGLVMGLLGRPVGRLYDRLGPRPLVLPGVVTVAMAACSLVLVDEGTPPVQVMASHVALCAGLALVFTPLFTFGLGSLPASLYPHGSAILASLQQVAGAAGTAVFVTVMSIGTASAVRQGHAPDAAVSSGVRLAFLAAGLITLLPVGVALSARSLTRQVEPSEPS
ncbi:MAG: MDR family MFS transporter [Dermatophilaceae bacterium]